MDNKTARTRLTSLAVFTFSLMALALFPNTGHSDQTAVVSTVASDYSGGAHSVIAVDPLGGPRSVTNNLLPTLKSDITVAAFGRYFYRIEKFMADNVTKFDIADPGTHIWQYSTLDAGDTDSSNPYDLIFVSDDKAYLLRYGKTTAWIVNPSAASQAGFKIGELDLSAYADGDGLPEMHGGVVVGDKLFIAMQRIERLNNWAATNDAYVAVFDTTTDTEIATKPVYTDGRAGIQLPIRNTGAIQYLAANGLIYVQGGGDFNSAFSGRAPGYTGGIVSIDPVTYDVVHVLDDGDDFDHPYGYITGMSIVAADKGYFVGYAGWGDNTLYAFDPATGVVSGPAHPDLAGINIAGMEAGTYADQNGMLWVCNQTAAEVVILDTTDNSIDETISTDLKPTRVVFTNAGEPGTGGSTAGTASGCFIGTLKK